jgi:pimeloyl-ACP methyl ester carboxylesterase
MPFADNDGVRIHYEVEGEGPPLVLCHGLSLSLEFWRILGYVEALKRNYRLILIDARGHGNSDKPRDPEAYSYELMVADVVTVLDALSIEKAHYLGYSMGGFVGWLIGKHAPDRFHSLIIGGSSPLEQDPDTPDPAIEWWTSLFRQGNEAVITTYETMMGVEFPPEAKKVLMENDAEALVAVLSIMEERVDYDETIANATIPCLVYTGEADPHNAATKKSRDALPNATFVTLPGLDHFAAFMRSDLVLPHILEFLGKMIPT